MKYIDADKLIAEIKRYKNKADERLKIKGRTFGEEQKDLALQNLCGNLLHFITSLQQEQPEGGCSEKPNNLPSNLDEAAQKIGNYYDVGEEHGYLCCHRGDIKDAFKAGAEWMAGQGVTMEAVIGMATEEISINVSQQTLDELNLCPGDKVVVQIRKK